MMPDHMFRIRMSHTVHMVYDRYLSIAMASSIVLASTVPSSGTILFTFSSSGISRWLSFVGGNFVWNKVVTWQTNFYWHNFILTSMLCLQPELYLSAWFSLAPVQAARSEAAPRSGHESPFLLMQPPSGLFLWSLHFPHPEVAGFPFSSPESQASSSPCRPAETERFLIRQNMRWGLRKWLI